MTMDMESLNKILEEKVKSNMTLIHPMNISLMMGQLETMSDDTLLEFTRCGHSILCSRIYGDDTASEMESFIVAHRKLFSLMLDALDLAEAEEK